MSRTNKKYSNGQPRFSQGKPARRFAKHYAEAMPERRKSLDASVEALTRMYGKPIKR